ncbi:MAG: N-acetylmuramoyl-L-alanine amidase [Gammaproteobacteria bacterium]
MKIPFAAPIVLCALSALMLAGCAGPQIDRTYTAKGQSSRAKFIVLHYTVADRNKSITILSEQVVSAHYLVTDDPTPVIYGLVDEARQANHAGVSYWRGYTNLNASSIGIEIVNRGFTEGPGGRTWYPFPQNQIDQVIKLVKDIAARHNIPPENVIGHADVAPTRKQDPGPLFPWKQLIDAGLALGPDPARYEAALPVFEASLPDVAWFQQKLAAFGYSVPQSGQLDDGTRAALVVFQMHFRPVNMEGNPDAETAALLDALVKPQAP